MAFLVGCGTAPIDEEYQKENTGTVEATTTSINIDDSEEIIENGGVEEEKEATEKVIPTERTVDTQGNYPWQYFTQDYIEEMLQDGEIIYVLDDAEMLEQHIIDTASMETDNNDFLIQNKKDSSDSFAKTVELFLNEVEEFIENKEYVNKLKEIRIALLNHEYDLIITLTEEAKQIRESE